MIFVDEGGVTTRMTRLYAGAPEGDWQILTMLGAVSTRAMIAAITIEAAPPGGDIPRLSECTSCPRGEH